MSPYPELDHLSLADLIACFEGPPVDGWSYAASYFAEVAFRIKECGAAGEAFLFARLAPPPRSSARLRGILGALASLSPQQTEALRIFREYVRDRRPLVVASAIDGLEVFRDTDAHDIVLSLRAHPSPYVRGAVLRYMARLFQDEARPMLYAALHDPHYIVRECAIDAFDDYGMVEALPAVRPLLRDLHPDVRQAAEWMVAQATRGAANI